MIILGVDPGTIKTGYGIVKYDQKELRLLHFGIINLAKEKTIPDKLSNIYAELSNLIRKYKPTDFSIETTFFGKNVQSALKVGYARGVSLLAAVQYQLFIGEYSPREIKKSIVGTGAASKEQVNYMVKTLLNVRNKIPLDASDALGAAICHAFRKDKQTPSSKSWKAFAEAFPERIVE
ncbi:MAG: crossover junction endodeoxyribonuclease RuvC [Ignavibacteria bacterium CG22_combo_CG10-13_8_21_14_all_37_15]|nr:MAG: crossover junction endodeoxyribonuclease RuvC [Ignavibacteria bacterium CG22_combo_CG10-13_8_21_14_all_37_15]